MFRIYLTERNLMQVYPVTPVKNIFIKRIYREKSQSYSFLKTFTNEVATSQGFPDFAVVNIPGRNFVVPLDGTCPYISSGSLPDLFLICSKSSLAIRIKYKLKLVSIQKKSGQNCCSFH